MAKGDTPKELIEALDMVRGTGGPAPQSLDALKIQGMSAASARSSNHRTSSASGLPKNTHRKRTTGELGLCFYVEKKLPKSKMTISKMIPPVLSVADRQAVFTDVLAVGRIRPQINKQRAPIVSGFSVGNSVDTGTLGAIVKKGAKFFVLSNSHVLAKSGKGKAGDVIVYPGRLNTLGRSRTLPRSRISCRSNSAKISTNRIDAALAEMKKDAADKLDFSIRGAKAPFATIAPVRGMKIVTRGRTSGNTEGGIQDVHFSVVVPYPGLGKVGFIRSSQMYDLFEARRFRRGDCRQGE